MKYKYVNMNPSYKFTGDCVIRAIANALNQSWEDTLKELTEVSCRLHMMPNEREVTSEYLKSKGWTKHNGNQKKLKDFRFKSTHICSMSYNKNRHMTFVRDGVIEDTYNCENMKVDYYFNPPK